MRIATCLPPRTLLHLGLDERFPEAAPGRAVYLRTDKRTRLLCVRCREGWLALEGIYYDQKKVMTPVDFNNGFLSKGKSQMFVRDTGTWAETWICILFGLWLAGSVMAQTKREGFGYRT